MLVDARTLPEGTRSKADPGIGGGGGGVAGDGLARALAVALQRARITCVVRDAGASATRVERWATVLVAREALSRVDATLGALGLVRVVDGERVGWRHYLGFDEATGAWSCVEVVAEPWYGSATRPRRATRGDGPLGPEDDLVDLLLRGLLDDGAFAPAARERLRWLRTRLLAARGAPRGAGRDAGRDAVAAVERRLAPALDWAQIDAAIAADRWDALLARRAAVSRQLFWRAPATHLWQWSVGALGRRLAAWRGRNGRRGLVVALLGPDGAGKTALAEALAADRPLRARRVYLGTNRDGGDALALHRWVDARRQASGRLGRVARPALHALGFVTHLGEQRYRHALALRHRARGGLVVFDRFAFDLDVNVALQRARDTWRRRARNWLLHAGAPKPDVVLVLDAPGEVLYARKREHSPEQLERMRRAYLDLQARHPEVVVIDATRDGEAVRRTVTALLWARHGARVRAVGAS